MVKPLGAKVLMEIKRFEVVDATNIPESWSKDPQFKLALAGQKGAAIIDGVAYNNFQEYRDREGNTKLDKFEGTAFHPLQYFRSDERKDEETHVTNLEDDEENYAKAMNISASDLKKNKSFYSDLPEDRGFFADLASSWKQGYGSGRTSNESWEVFKKGDGISSEDLKALIVTNKKIEELGNTNEQAEFAKDLEKYGGGVFGTLRAFAENPGFAPQAIVSSIGTMAGSFVDSEEVWGTALASAGAGAVAGAGIGSLGFSLGPFGVLTTAGGAVTGTVSGFIGGLVGSMETGLTLTDLLKDELDGAQFNEENVIRILENKDVFDKIKARACERGITIGAFEAVTAGLSRGIASNMIRSSREVGETGIKTGLKISASTTALEMAGGAGGEYAGQLAQYRGEGLKSSGKKVNISDVVVEGLIEAKGVVNVADVISESLKNSEYTINGEKRTKKEIRDLVNNPNTPIESLAKINFEIKNDDEFNGFVRSKQNDAFLETQVDAKVEDIADRKRMVTLENERVQAEVDSKKKGISMVPGAKEKLENIEIEMSEIVGKYTAIDGRSSDVKARAKTAQDVLTRLDEINTESTRIASSKTTATIKKQMEALDKKTGRKGQVIEMNPDDIAESHAETVAELEAEVQGYGQKLSTLDPKSKKYKDTKSNLDFIEGQLNGISEADLSYGYIVDYTDGNYDIILNRSKPMIGTAAHEFQHKILSRTLKNDQKLQDGVGGALTKYVNDKLGGVSSSFIDRMGAYINPETGEQVGEFGEEIVTVMSESILDGSLKFNENLFTKVGDVIRQTLQRVGAIDIKFDTGRDVYNFIKDYNRSIEKDYVSKAITKMAAEGAKGKLTETDTDTKATDTQKDKTVPGERKVNHTATDSKGNTYTYFANTTDKGGVTTTKFTFNRSDKASTQRNAGGVPMQVALGDKYTIDPAGLDEGVEITQVLEIREGETGASATVRFEDGNGNQFNGEVVLVPTTGKKAGGAKFSKEASDEVQRIYDEKGNAGVFDIIEQFKPIVNKIVQKRSGAPGFDRELLTSEIEIGKRGILDLVREYDPKSGVPLAAFINKYLPARAIEASRRVLGEEFMDDVDTVVNIAGEEVSTETEVKPERKKVVLSDKLGVKSKVDSAIKAKLSTLDLENLNFKNLKDQTPEITGELFGIDPKKLISSANITKKELQSAQMFINKNADLLLSMLPEGATTGGTATGVPKTLLDAFYIKADRAKMAKTGSKAGLAIQVKKGNISNKEFLEVFGIIDGKPVRDDRNTSARVLALANQTGKMMSNQAIRQLLANNVTEKATRLKLRLSDGKSTVMFSKNNSKKLDMPNILDYFKDKTEQEAWSIFDQYANLTNEEFEQQYPDNHFRIKDFIEDMTMFRADGGKAALQFMMEMKETDFGNKALNEYLKTGFWNLSDEKFKQDTSAQKWFLNNAHDLANNILISKDDTNGNKGIILGFFAGHYNIVGSDMAKVGSALKQGIIDRLNKKGDSVLSKETLERWKNFNFNGLKGSYASTFYTGLKKIYAAGSLKEQKALAKEYFTGEQSALQRDFYNLWNTTLEEWLHSNEVGSNEFNSKADFILKLKKANAAIGTTGERIMAPGGYVYLPGSVVSGRIKFEHLKSSSQQSKESAILILNNKFKEFGEQSTDRYIGIYGPLELFNAIDAATGKVNSADIFRLAGNLEAAKSIYNIDNLDVSLYDEIVAMLGKDKVTFLEQKLVEKDQKKIGTAIMFSRTANPAKGISVLDFDDTLATTKSGVRYTLPNPDGTPQPKKKVIFMAGGPGSGKSNVINQLGLKEQGFKVVNQDISLEWLMKNHGMPTDMREFTPEQASQFGKLSHEARGIALKKRIKYQGEGDGVIIDGTGASLNVMKKNVQDFQDKGYDVQMIFVETSQETALSRNKARKERSLRTGIVIKTHDSVQANKEAYKELFGERFAEVNTDNLKQGDVMPADVVNKVNNFTSGYIKGRLNAGEYATKGEELRQQGAEFDFSEFNQVVEGRTAPLFNKAMKLQEKFTSKDMFVLTARPAESNQAIFEFLQANGLNIPIENIVGLGSSLSSDKALWMAGKVGEGYNDFYFADDILENVQAVSDMLAQFDVKSKVQQAKRDFVLGDPKVTKLLDEKSMNDVKDVDGLANPGVYSNVKFSKSHRAEYENTVAKNRPDLSGKEVTATIDKMFEYIDGLDVPNKRKYEQITTKWLATSNIKLPEDSYKIQQAVEIAELKKEDIFSYKNPNEIIEKYAGTIKVKPISPAGIKEFH
jgi:predicted kinase